MSLSVNVSAGATSGNSGCSTMKSSVLMITRCVRSSSDYMFGFCCLDVETLQQIIHAVHSTHQMTLSMPNQVGIIHIFSVFNE